MRVPRRAPHRGDPDLAALGSHAAVDPVPDRAGRVDRARGPARLAFHPDYTSNGYSCVDHTDPDTKWIAIACSARAAGHLYALDLDDDVFQRREPAGGLPLEIGFGGPRAVARAAARDRGTQSSNTGRRFSRNARIPSCASGCCDADAITSVA